MTGIENMHDQNSLFLDAIDDLVISFHDIPIAAFHTFQSRFFRAHVGIMRKDFHTCYDIRTNSLRNTNGGYFRIVMVDFP